MDQTKQLEAAYSQLTVEVADLRATVIGYRQQVNALQNYIQELQKQEEAEVVEEESE